MAQARLPLQASGRGGGGLPRRTCEDQRRACEAGGGGEGRRCRRVSAQRPLSQGGRRRASRYAAIERYWPHGLHRRIAGKTRNRGCGVSRSRRGTADEERASRDRALQALTKRLIATLAIRPIAIMNIIVDDPPY